MDVEMEAEAYSHLTPIQRFFFGRSVFVTGATGLIGKVLLEKLLRCCPGIGRIYILVRPKKGLSPDQRLDSLFSSPLYEPIAKSFPGFRKLVGVVEGDLEQDRLGISNQHFEELQRNVSVVFHSAARVKFDDPIRLAAQNNLIATGNILEICKELPNLAVVVHVSTAYAHRDADLTVPEHITKCDVSPDQLLSALEWMDDATLAKVTPRLLKDKNNTYLFTKALAEDLVARKRGNLPTAVVRPCNITATWKEPFPGWIDTIQGPSGLFLAAAKGFLRTLYSLPDLKIVLIPVDVVCNTMIASAYQVGTQKPEEILVVNCTPEYETSPMAGTGLLKEVLKKRETMPLSSMYRYPDVTLYFWYPLYFLHSLFDQWIPALFLDLFIYLGTGKTLMLRLYKKMDYLYGIFLAVGSKPWIFKLHNFYALRNNLTEEDSEIFFMNMDNFDWLAYMDICIAGGRKFLAKEHPSNIPYALKKAKIWLYVTTFLKWCIILYVVYRLIPTACMDHVYSVQDQFFSINSP